MSKADINKKAFTVVGELSEDCSSITIDHHKALRRVIKFMVGKKLEINLKLLRYTRTAAQNRYLWGVCYTTICSFHKETTGEVITKEDIHFHTLQHILDYRLEAKEIMGKETLVVHGKSTSNLNTKEFGDLIDKLHAFWGEKGCIIPEPRQNNFLSDFVKDE